MVRSAWASFRRCQAFALLAAVGILAGYDNVRGAPAIVAPDVVRVDLIASDAVTLLNVDMLAFDAYGNLFANRETSGSTGGTSYVNVAAGTATSLVSGISRCDGITLHPSGAMYVTSETSGASTNSRVYRLDIFYDANNVPLSATATSITTSLAINNPEGIVALEAAGAYGSAGDLIVAEDATPGRIIRLALGPGNTATASVLVGTATNLRRPEGLGFGDFAGALPEPSLFAAETTDDNVLSITSGGAVSVLGLPAAVSLNEPDNLEFGHDGKLYISEDVGSGNGRIVRAASNGAHEVVLGGFNFPQGMAFDLARSDLYIAEQGSARIWRARFFTATEDCDLDGDVDLRDYAGLAACFELPEMPVECLVFDIDRNDVIESDDVAAFVSALAGP